MLSIQKFKTISLDDWWYDVLGIIIRCSIKLKKAESGWISQNIINKNLDETIKSFYEHEDSTYSVAWIDCFASGNSFGRSILMLGERKRIC